MLLSKDDYVDLIEKSDVPKSKGNLFCYILDNTDEKMNVVKNIEKQRHLSSFFMKGDCGNWTEDLEKESNLRLKAGFELSMIPNLLLLILFMHACSQFCFISSF